MVGEETEVRKMKEGLLKRHGLKAGGGSLIAVLAWLGSGVMDDMKSMSERLVTLETENRDIREKQFESVWRTMYLMKDDVDENKIDIGVVRELMAHGIGGTQGSGIDMRAMMESLEALVEEEDMEFEEHQVEEFRQMQQQYQMPQGKK